MTARFACNVNTSQILLAICIICCILLQSSAFRLKSCWGDHMRGCNGQIFSLARSGPSFSKRRLEQLHPMRLFACRRNNKDEKQQRNYFNALKYRSKDGISRKKKVKAAQRAAEVAKQEGFSEKIFQFTTDADIPPFDDFFD